MTPALSHYLHRRADGSLRTAIYQGEQPVATTTIGASATAAFLARLPTLATTAAIYCAADFAPRPAGAITPEPGSAHAQRVATLSAQGA